MDVVSDKQIAALISAIPIPFSGTPTSVHVSRSSKHQPKQVDDRSPTVEKLRERQAEYEKEPWPRNDYQCMMRVMEKKEEAMAVLEDTLRGQSEEFARRMDEKQQEVQAAKEQQCLLEARVQARLRDIEEGRVKLEDMDRRQREHEAEFDKLRELHLAKCVDATNFRTELKECEQQRDVLQLAHTKDREAHTELAALREVLDDKDRTIAKFKEERFHRPKKREDYVLGFGHDHGFHPEVHDVVMCGVQTDSETRGAENEVTRLRERLVAAERQLKEVSEDAMAQKLGAENEIARLRERVAAERDLNFPDVMAQKLGAAESEVTRLRERLVAAERPIQDDALAQKLGAAESEATRLRERLVAAERPIQDDAMAQKLGAAESEVTRLRGRLVLFEQESAHTGVTDALALRQEIDALRTELLAASTSEREAQHVACSVLDELKEVRLSLDVLEQEKRAITMQENQTMASCRSELAALQQQIAHRDSDVERYKRHMAEAADEIATLRQGDMRAEVQMRFEKDKEVQMQKWGGRQVALEDEITQLRTRYRGDEEKMDKLRAESRSLHREKAEMSGLRRDMELQLDELRWQLKMHDLEKLKIEEDKEQEVNDLRKEVDALRKSKVDHKAAHLLEDCRRDNLTLQEKVKNLEKEKASIELLREQFAREVTLLRNSLQDQSQEVQLKQNVQRLEREKKTGLQDHEREVCQLKQRIGQLENDQEQRRRSLSSHITRGGTPLSRRDESYDESPQPPRFRSRVLSTAGSSRWPDVEPRRSLRSTQRSVDSMNRSSWEGGSVYRQSRGSGSFRASRAEATMRGFWDSDSETSLERLVSESDPLRRG